MTGEKIKEVTAIYRERLTAAGYAPERFRADDTPACGQSLRHLLFMLDEIDDFVTAERMDKANRWLGFVQGVLWRNGLYTLEDLKSHNMPPGEVLDANRV